MKKLIVVLLALVIMASVSYAEDLNGDWKLIVKDMSGQLLHKKDITLSMSLQDNVIDYYDLLCPTCVYSDLTVNRLEGCAWSYVDLGDSTLSLLDQDGNLQGKGVRWSWDAGPSFEWVMWKLVR